MLRYIIHNWGDVEPMRFGPYKDEAARIQAARRIRRKEGEDGGALIRLTISPRGIPKVSPFFGFEMERSVKRDYRSTAQRRQ